MRLQGPFQRLSATLCSAFRADIMATPLYSSHVFFLGSSIAFEGVNCICLLSFQKLFCKYKHQDIQQFRKYAME